MCNPNAKLISAPLKIFPSLKVWFCLEVGFRQYMPAKAMKYRIKVWMAADSSNGYVLNFDVYLGKEASNRQIHGLGYDVVTNMVTPFMNKNHHVNFEFF